MDDSIYLKKDSEKLNTEFNLFFTLENCSFPSTLKHKNTVIKYTKLPNFDAEGMVFKLVIHRDVVYFYIYVCAMQHLIEVASFTLFLMKVVRLYFRLFHLLMVIYFQNHGAIGILYIQDFVALLHSTINQFNQLGR